jgi:DNA-binding IclR family transcriptional regulator
MMNGRDHGVMDEAKDDPVRGTAAPGRSERQGRRAVSQTLDRGLEVIDLVAAAPDGRTVAQLAELLGTPRTNVVRLLNTLAGRNYVVQNAGGRYHLGSRPLELARLVQPVIRLIAQKVLQHLADRTGATAHLTAAEGDDAVALLVVEPRTADYHVSYQAGARRPLNRGASGFAILSARPPAAAELPEVAAARKRGWAVSHGQIERGTWGIAAPIRHPQHPDLSVGVVYLGEPADLDSATRAVLKAAEEISVQVG